MERCAVGREGKEGSGNTIHFFFMCLSCHAGSDMTGRFGIAGPGFLVNALMWV